MITSITVNEGTLEKEVLLFSSFKCISSFNLLVGGNGVGKTTLLNAIVNQKVKLDCDREIIVLHYKDRSHNFKVKYEMEIKVTLDMFVKQRNASELSEGQSIMYSLMSFLDHVRTIAKANQDKTVVVLLDEVDSGLSIENLNVLCHIMNDTHQECGNTQWFIATNHYHQVYVFKWVINMYNGQKTKIENYDEFMMLLLSNMASLAKQNGKHFMQIPNWE